jgi:hypothetical protein
MGHPLTGDAGDGFVLVKLQPIPSVLVLRPELPLRLGLDHADAADLDLAIRGCIETKAVGGD